MVQINALVVAAVGAATLSQAAPTWNFGNINLPGFPSGPSAPAAPAGPSGPSAPAAPAGPAAPSVPSGPGVPSPAGLQKANSQLSFNPNPWAYSCQAPWKPASKPSFTIGCPAGNVPSWNGGDLASCSQPWLAWTPFCQKGNPTQPLPSGCNPPKTPSNGPVCDMGYQQTFKDYTTNATSGVYQGTVVGAATVDNDNYITYVLANSTDSCLTACNQTSGCVFVNVYQDNAANASDVSELPPSAQSKYTKGNLTCALYKACSGTDKATNYAGQQDPTYITQSSGYCKGGNCAASS